MGNTNTKESVENIRTVVAEKNHNKGLAHLVVSYTTLALLVVVIAVVLGYFAVRKCTRAIVKAISRASVEPAQFSA